MYVRPVGRRGRSPQDGVGTIQLLSTRLIARTQSVARRTRLRSCRSLEHQRFGVFPMVRGCKQEHVWADCARAARCPLEGRSRSVGRVRLGVLLALLIAGAVVLMLLHFRGRRAGGPAPSPRRSPAELAGPDPAVMARVQEWESRVAADPDDSDARLRLAEAYLEAQRPRDAVSALQHVSDAGGQRHLLLGRAYEELRDVEAAEDHYRMARSQSPETAEPLSRLGLLLARTGRFEEGNALCRQAVEEHPDDYDALVRLARVRIRAEDMGRAGQEEAREALTRAIELRPEGAEAYALMARSLLTHEERALEYATKALELDPRSADAYEVLGWIYYLRPPTDENLRLAEEAFLEGLARNPDDAALHFRLGILYGRAGRTEESVRELEEALAAAAGSAEVWYALSAAYDRAGRHEEANELRRHVRSQSRFHEQEARHWLELRYAPTDPDTYARMAEFYLKYGKNRLAAKAASKALELDPEHEDASRVLRSAMPGGGP